MGKTKADDNTLKWRFFNTFLCNHFNVCTRCVQSIPLFIDYSYKAGDLKTAETITE